MIRDARVLLSPEVRASLFSFYCSTFLYLFPRFEIRARGQGYAYWRSQMVSTSEPAADWCERFGGGVYGELVAAHGHTVTSACCFCGLRTGSPTATPTVRLRGSFFPQSHYPPSGIGHPCQANAAHV